MTCCVAIEHPRGVTIGCDSFVGGDEYADDFPQPKWFKRDGMTLAFSGTITIAQAVEHMPAIRKRARNEDPLGYLVTTFVPAVRSALSLFGWPRIADAREDDEESPSSFIVVLAAKAYLLDDDLSVTRSRHGYVAIGAGNVLALGSLASTGGQPPRDRALAALKAAARHSPYVREPFDVVEA